MIPSKSKSLSSSCRSISREEINYGVVGVGLGVGEGVCDGEGVFVRVGVRLGVGVKVIVDVGVVEGVRVMVSVGVAVGVGVAMLMVKWIRSSALPPSILRTTNRSVISPLPASVGSQSIKLSGWS
jgi:hypothetical protein